MALLTVQNITRAGTEPTYVAATVSGDTVNNAGNVALHYKNASGGAITVTIVTPNTVDGLAVTDRAVAIPAGEERIIGPFQKAIYNDSTGVVSITYSGVTDLTVAALALTPVL
jgi:hypothetical protein